MTTPIGSTEDLGRVYRRCACRDERGKQLGTRCPKLADETHGTWSFTVDLPRRQDGKRRRVRRSGFDSKRDAQAALGEIRDRLKRKVRVDRSETVGAYLDRWCRGRRDLKPRTRLNYKHMVDKNIAPYLGHIRLDELDAEDVQEWATEIEDKGTGASVVKSAVAILRSALNDAVKVRRLDYNPAQHVRITAYRAAEREPWTGAEGMRFMECSLGEPPTDIKDPDTREVIGRTPGGIPWQPHRLAELYAALSLSSLRRGEALALRWSDIDMRVGVIHVRRSLTEVGGKLVEGTPKTSGSERAVSLSRPLAYVLDRQRQRQLVEREAAGSAWQDDDRVFTREDGSPLRPEYCLREFHKLSDMYGLRQVRLHDLRHLGATTMLANDVSLTTASKALGHSSVVITGNLYAHQTRETAAGAFEVLGQTLLPNRAPGHTWDTQPR